MNEKIPGRDAADPGENNDDDQRQQVRLPFFLC
jgi:hypothetical protein